MFALVTLVIVNTYVVRISGVKGTSMFPTLLDGERVLVQVAGYSTPEKGDIVVVIADNFDDEPLVKRVIGIAGDIIDIDPSNGDVTVNGDVLYEPYINAKILNRGNHEYPYTVPEGCIFVMGDNRNHSSDSRVESIGAIPYDNIIGKVFFSIWPISIFGKIV